MARLIHSDRLIPTARAAASTRATVSGGMATLIWGPMGGRPPRLGRAVVVVVTAHS